MFWDDLFLFKLFCCNILNEGLFVLYIWFDLCRLFNVFQRWYSYDWWNEKENLGKYLFYVYDVEKDEWMESVYVLFGKYFIFLWVYIWVYCDVML